MAKLNFPGSPSDGQTFTSGDISYVYSTEKGYWILTTRENLILSASTLENARNFSITGDITAAAVSFNGSANVTLNASIDNGTITSAKFSGADTVNIRNSAGTILKTIRFPGS